MYYIRAHIDNLTHIIFVHISDVYINSNFAVLSIIVEIISIRYKQNYVENAHISTVDIWLS